MTLHDDFLFRGDLSTLDLSVAQLIDLERERQARKLIMIPSESSSPWAVRQAMGSRLMSIYAEGYPNPETRWLTESEILDWIEHRSRWGFTEWHSDVYYQKDLTPLLSLVEWCEDEYIAHRAAMLRELLFLDRALHLP